MFTTIVATVFVLGVLIFVHELGHFLVAKRIGIRVERFSLGFPPKLISKKIGETEYCLSAIPLGGYVKMSGENPDEQSLSGAPWEFQSRTVWERMAVICAGPLMNLITAVLICWGMIALGGLATVNTTRVGQIESGSTADKMGFQTGDKILSVAGQPVKAWDDLYEAIEHDRGSELKMEVERGQQVHTLAISRREMSEPPDYTLGLSPFIEPEIGTVTGNKPAERIGLKPGDKIVAIDGQPIDQWDEMARIIHEKPGLPVTVTWVRGQDSLKAEITPEKVETMDADGRIKDIGLIGIEPKFDRKRVGLFASLWMGVQQTAYMIEMTVGFVKKLIFGEVSTKLIGGPVSIARMAGETARSGLLDLFGLMALLSVNLGILNILPIPVLDGGHILFLFVEAVTRRPLSLRQRSILQQIGFVLLILLMIYTTRNDILRILSK